MDRARHVAAALARALPADRARAVALLVASLGPPLATTEGWGTAPFAYLPHVFFLAEHGLDVPEAALAAQRELTKRFTAEFSLGVYVERHPALTFATLAAWVEDPDPHVRRLVSEGTRSRLPWGKRLKSVTADPAPVLALLARLRDDPSAYVRRSVANNLNDLGKDDPGLLVRVARAWLVDAPPARVALIRHALRDRVKKGDRDAIALLGAGGGEFTVRAELPARAPLGGKLAVVVHVTNVGAGGARAVVDLAVTFPGRAGKGRRRVFKMKEVTLEPGQSATLRATVSLAHHTTRAALPGPHALAVQVDGVPMPVGTVDVA
jgi:3-methyladenine DNA glycosylase AlkC